LNQSEFARLEQSTQGQPEPAAEKPAKSGLMPSPGGTTQKHNLVATNPNEGIVGEDVASNIALDVTARRKEVL